LHRLIVLTDTIDYRTIKFSNNRPNPRNNNTAGRQRSYPWAIVLS